MTDTAPASVHECSVTVDVDLGRADVEHAAESLGVALSEEEIDAILANLDDDLADLAATATRSAVAARIYAALAAVARGHAWSDDD